MPDLVIRYGTNETADLVRRDAQDRMGRSIAAAQMKEDPNGGWVIILPISDSETDTE